LPPRNPWAEPVPRELSALRAAIKRGAQPPRSALQELYRYSAMHPRDPRGLLLLGRTYKQRHWEKDALDAYRDAHARDSSARGDLQMLQDMVEMAEGQRSHQRASAYIVRWFGREAFSYVAERSAHARDAGVKARLAELQAALTSALP
jgi:predicted Zn-dependent protease